MRRATLKRLTPLRKARYGASVRPVRCVAVRVGRPFLCPVCGAAKMALGHRYLITYGRAIEKQNAICGGCKRVVVGTAFHGRCYDSLTEFERGEFNLDRQARGEICNYQEQVAIDMPILNKNGTWRADSVYWESAAGNLGGLDCQVYESVEGVSDTAHQVLARVWRMFGPGTLRIVRRNRTRWIENDVPGNPAAHAEWLAAKAKA